MSGTDRFRAARDFLLVNRTDYDVAYKGFQWPRLEHFNWALDWFDSIAAGERCDQPALWVVFEDGKEIKLSFRQLSNRSSQIANYYRELGVGRGDRVLVMLGNVPPLWETVLALIKIGAVILLATPLLSGGDLADRVLTQPLLPGDRSARNQARAPMASRQSGSFECRPLPAT